MLVKELLTEPAGTAAAAVAGNASCLTGFGVRSMSSPHEREKQGEEKGEKEGRKKRYYYLVPVLAIASFPLLPHHRMERWKFIHPFTARFVGPTACGKTTFLMQVIQQKLIHPWLRKIFYFYGSTWQPGTFDHLQSVHNVTFVKGFDESVVTENDSRDTTLVICDDLILELRDSEAAANLFMRGSHHLNMSVILIEQSLFPKGKQSVSMKQNTHYVVIFKSPADALGVATLARQMFPQKRGKFLIDAFHDCTKEPFSYLIIDAKQSTPDEIRLITNVTNEDEHPVVYIPCGHKDGITSIRSFNERKATATEAAASSITPFVAISNSNSKKSHQPKSDKKNWQQQTIFL